MIKRQRTRRPSPALLIACLALFVALGSGAYAAFKLPNNSVKSKHVKDNALKSADLKDGKAVSGSDVIDESLTGADVATDSLTGPDIVESSLGQVPTALQGGLGRYGFTGSCDPETATFIACSTVQVTLASPARLLVMGTVRARPENDAENADGTCRIGTTSGPVAASEVRMLVRDHSQVGGGDDELASVVAVTDPFPAGTHAVGIDCNQSGPGAIQYDQARVVAVALSAG